MVDTRSTAANSIDMSASSNVLTQGYLMRAEIQFPLTSLPSLSTDGSTANYEALIYRNTAGVPVARVFVDFLRVYTWTADGRVKSALPSADLEVSDTDSLLAENPFVVFTDKEFESVAGRDAPKLTPGILRERG